MRLRFWREENDATHAWMLAKSGPHWLLPWSLPLFSSKRRHDSECGSSLDVLFNGDGCLHCEKKRKFQRRTRDTRPYILLLRLQALSTPKIFAMQCVHMWPVCSVCYTAACFPARKSSRSYATHIPCYYVCMLSTSKSTHHRQLRTYVANNLVE